MKKLKIMLTTLALSFVLVVSVSFSSKPCMPVDFLYNNPSGQALIQPGIPGLSIIPSELICDYNSDGYPDSWTPGSVTGHTNGPYLMGIEFNSYELSLQTAANNIYLYYFLFGSLPADNTPLQTIFGFHYIYIFRMN